MSYLPSLAPTPDGPPFTTLRQLLTKYGHFAHPLLHMEEAIMRPVAADAEAIGQKQTLAVADREMIAAFTSALNSCKWCLGVHEKVAASYGVDVTTLKSAVDNLDSAPLEPRTKAILAYVKKITLDPGKTSPKDVKPMFDNGLTERDVFDVCSACATFNFMNRLTSGLGCEANHEVYAGMAGALVEMGYAKLAPPRPEPKA